MNPVVNGSINGTLFSFEDTTRVLLGHEEAGNTAETTPYVLLGRVDIPAVPEPSSMTLLLIGAVIAGAACRRRRDQRV